MKLLSAAAMKGDKHVSRRLPTEGSKIRKLYDLFMLYRGVAAPLDSIHSISDGAPLRSSLNQLIDVYGLDIRTFPIRTRGDRMPWERGRHVAYCLVGEWKGRHYHDYLADRVR